MHRILVVDDDPNVLQVVCISLIQAGFSISSAANGVDAVKKAKSVSHDLIVLDVMMPEMDGFAVCEVLRKDPTTVSTPILMITGLHSHISRLAGMEMGATDFLLKPFDAEQLVSKVETLLYQALAPSKRPVNHKANPALAHSHSHLNNKSHDKTLVMSTLDQQRQNF